MKFWFQGMALLVVALVVAVGCTTPSDTNKPKPTGGGTTGHDHSDWWCKEHGIPEEECSMCQKDVIKEAKAKGDWCDKHDRAKSQCFICDPKLKEKFDAKYRAKYGKEPPPPNKDFEK